MPMEQSDLLEIKAAQRRNIEAICLIANSSFQGDDFLLADQDEKEAAEERTHQSHLGRRPDDTPPQQGRQEMGNGSFSDDMNGVIRPTSLKRQRSRGLESRKSIQAASAHGFVGNETGKTQHDDPEESSIIQTSPSFRDYDISRRQNRSLAISISSDDCESLPAATPGRDDRPGAFSAVGNEARAQRKGTLTPLDQNRIIPSYSSSSSCVEQNATTLERERLQETAQQGDEHLQNTSPIRLSRRHWRIFYWSVLLAGCVSAGLVAGVVLSKQKQPATNQKDASLSLHIDEVVSFCSKAENGGKSFDSFLADTDISQLQQMGDTISAELESGTMNMTVCSPRSLATLRMAATNPTIKARLIRYALLVFYYSTNGPRWNNFKQKWLSSSSDHCSWYGVLCETNSESVLELDLESNSLEGTLPSELFLLTTLRSIDLQLNELEGTVPTEIGNLNSLTKITLEGNLLSGRLPVEIKGLTGLELFNVAYNEFTGQSIMILDLFLDLPKLTHLSIAGLSMIGLIPTEIGNMSNLKKLKMGSNTLESTLPSEIGLLKDLVWFDASKNAMIGQIPSEMGQMTLLEYLWVDSNFMTGPIPSEIGILTSLTNLQLGNNQLSGSLPSEMSRLSNMVRMDLTWLEAVFGSLVAFCSNIDVTSKTRITVNPSPLECPCCTSSYV